MHELSCAEVQDRAPGFALDILDPESRADVAAHLRRCRLCCGTVSDMQCSAAELLDLDRTREATAAGLAWSAAGWPDQPWTGDHWPDEVWAGTGAGGPPRRSRLRLAAAMTAATLLFVGSALGPELAQGGGRAPVPVASAQLLAGAAPVGYVYIYGGSDPFLVVQVAGIPVSGQLICQLSETDGTVVALGSFKLFDGRAQWAARDGFPADATSAISLVDARHEAVAVASLGR